MLRANLLLVVLLVVLLLGLLVVSVLLPLYAPVAGGFSISFLEKCKCQQRASYLSLGNSRHVHVVHANVDAILWQTNIATEAMAHDFS